MGKFLESNWKRKLSMVGSAIMILATAYSSFADLLGLPAGELVMESAVSLTALIGTFLGCDTIVKVVKEGGDDAAKG